MKFGYARVSTEDQTLNLQLDALKAAVPEQVVDPAAYYFHKAVAEHALVQKKDAVYSISRLLDDVTEAPERYKMVATLMFMDMRGWKDEEKDLSNIARLMDNVERRLDLARGGPKTQDIQKKIVFRLDEIIKELENQSKSQCNGGNCPGGGKPGNKPGSTLTPSSPMLDSMIGGGSGPGKVDDKKLRQYAESWGGLPPGERAKIVEEITRDLPAKYKPMIDEYFKSLNRIHGFKNN